MKIQGIDHVTLYVRNVEAVKLYYEQVFDFSCSLILSKGKKHLQLETDTTHLFIAEDSTFTPDFIGQQHISFEVESLEPVVKKLDARGEQYETGMYTGFKTRNYRWCEWRDPEGIRVECVEHI
jgi:catechol 2,3-dioxygenase-like lactoylglutathione lyase family enzyme